MVLNRDTPLAELVKPFRVHPTQITELTPACCVISCGKRARLLEGDYVAPLMRPWPGAPVSQAVHKPPASAPHYLSLSPQGSDDQAPNHVRAANITYIPMARGFLYLFAVLDWASRRVLAWRLSNTLTTDCCLEAVQEALASSDTPEIFNTDQITSQEFTSLLKDHGIQISMDGTGCWRDNVFVERLWKSIKHEEVYLHAYDTVNAAHQGLERYLTFYNQTRPHRALVGQTPDQVYYANLTTRQTAA